MTSPLWEGVREGCGTCEFAGPGVFGSEYECRRYPPTVDVRAPSTRKPSYRPQVREDWWCGEYKRRGT